ncbi:GNAT family N-acetyltransferase [Streptomyces sp. N2-109]|uniref:GNAT family N-acetyltransferase n=1 Tax=Streptomyces gossypii TaxID=2883101 RepID=A0ABT2JZU1_9ACTN|nr:GNAT family N-acetyltransferase [Streptomyces gossypii]MCT2593429.1 GNAT family N-acetyltransferase [Streptomyces gossypii]
MRIREMTEADVGAVAAVRVRGWQHAYAGLMPQEYLDSLSSEGDAGERRRAFTRTREVISNFVAEDTAGRITGWAALGPYREGDLPPAGRPFTSDGEVYALYVHPESIGTGTGRALMDVCLRQAEARSFPRVLLWVVKGNARARRFYERAGFHPDGAEESYDVQGVPVPEVRYAKRLAAA